MTAARTICWGRARCCRIKLVFVVMHFVGAVLPLTVIWNLGDIFLAIVIVPNLIALIMLAPKVAGEANSYFSRKPWLRQPGSSHQKR